MIPRLFPLTRNLCCKSGKLVIREIPFYKAKMDAYLVGYGSSSDEEGKTKKQSMEIRKVG